MPRVFKIDGPVADKYHGCGYALAAVTGDQIVDLVYLHDALPGFDGEDRSVLTSCLSDTRLSSTVRYLSSLGEVFVGMCSCYEFMEI